MIKLKFMAIFLTLFSASPTIAAETVSPDMQIIVDLLAENDCGMSGKEAVAQPALNVFEGAQIKDLVSEMVKMGIATLGEGDFLSLTDEYCPS